MPHPEHAVEPLTGPTTDGLRMFTSVLSTLAPADANPPAIKDIAPPVALARRGLPAWVGVGARGLLGFPLYSMADARYRKI